MTLSRRSLLKLAIAGAAHPLLPMRGIVSQAFADVVVLVMPLHIIEADPKFFVVFGDLDFERLARGQTIYTRSSGAVSWGTISLSLDALAAIGVAMAGREFCLAHR